VVGEPRRRDQVADGQVAQEREDFHPERGRVGGWTIPIADRPLVGCVLAPTSLSSPGAVRWIALL
jgi:hypothetical protein